MVSRDLNVITSRDRHESTARVINLISRTCFKQVEVSLPKLPTSPMFNSSLSFFKTFTFTIQVCFLNLILSTFMCAGTSHGTLNFV